MKQLKAYFTHRRSLCIGLVFAAVGFCFGNWATLIPYIKEKFDLNDAQLGLLLLSFPFGSTVANPISTIIIDKLGANRTTFFFLILMAILYQTPIIAPTIPLVVIGLILTGICLANTNVAMNTAVAAIENHENRQIMATCHGMFSLGGMVGAAVASMSLGFDIQPEIHMPFISLSVVILAFCIKSTIFSIHEEKLEQEPKTKFTMPNRILLGMIAISLCTNITEGTMADWAAVYMKDVVHASNARIGWGFTAYAFFMAAGRFLGDAIIPRFGMKNVLIYGGFVSATGLLLSISMPNSVCTIIGFAMVGAGVSCGAPILYGSAARMPNMAKGAGLATMNTFSITGFLAGPAIIGFISKVFSLPFAFLLVAFLGVLWAFLASRNRLY